ncbi:MAG: M28 family peptidase [Pseudomonadota bacterium]
MRYLFYALVWLVILGAGSFWLLRNPVLSTGGPAASVRPPVDELKQDVNYLAGLSPNRSVANLASLNRAADYIRAELEKTGCPVTEQRFGLRGVTLRNISCFAGPEDAPRLIIGAHYDVYSRRNPGADDNASGVAGMLALARMIAREKPALEHQIEFVAYTHEEYSNIGPSHTGSVNHANRIKRQNVPLKLMISVEMIGYFKDEPGSQRMPLALLKPFYPDVANFIGVVGELWDRSNVKRVKSLMQSASDLPVYSLNAPVFIPEAGFSDHRSYWERGLPAVMVTDTAFLRNPNYHRPTDTPDTLDYERMADVVKGLYLVATRF